MTNERLHIERMLKRALRRQEQANLLVEKLTARMEALAPEPVRRKYPLLWDEEPDDAASSAQAPTTMPLPFEIASQPEAVDQRP